MADSTGLPPLPDRKEWPRELAQEHAHAQLMLTRLGALCDAPEGQTSCDECRPLGEAQCQRRFTPMLDEVAGFFFTHFINEERMMKAIEYPLSEPRLHAGHVEDHANLCEALFDIISDIEEAPAVALIRRLEAVLQRLSHQHVATYDTPFLDRLGVR